MEAEELTVDKLRGLAQTLDREGEVEISTPGEEDTDNSQESESESPADDNDNAPENEDENTDEEVGEEEPESSEIRDLKKIKEKERLDRTWKKAEERKAELDRRERELQERERKTAKQVDPRDEKDEDGFSVKDYEAAVKHFRDEGNEDLARQAEDKAKSLYMSSMQRRWQQNFADLVEEEPSLSDTKSPLYVAASKVLDAMPFLKGMPDGCVYAVRIAQGDISKSLISELKAENEKIKKELDRLNKATRIGPSGPGRMPSADNSGKPFESLPRKERDAILRRQAARADAGLLEED